MSTGVNPDVISGSRDLLAKKQVNDINNNVVNYPNNRVTENAAPEEAQEEFEEYQYKQHQSIITLPTAPPPSRPPTTVDSETPLTSTSITTSTIDSEQPVESSNCEINWDSEDRWHRRFWARTIQEKKERKRELLLIQEERQQLAHLRQNLDSRKSELEAREAKLQSVLPLVPSVRELQAIGVTFDMLFSYLMSVNEKAVTEGIEQKSAAREIAQILRAYRNLESLQKAVEKAEQQLKSLQVFSAAKNQAITTLLNLQLMGYSEKEIMNLAGWNKQQSSLGFGSPGLTQGNGSSIKLDDKLIGIGRGN